MWWIQILPKGRNICPYITSYIQNTVTVIVVIQYFIIPDEVTTSLFPFVCDEYINVKFYAKNIFKYLFIHSFIINCVPVNTSSQKCMPIWKCFGTRHNWLLVSEHKNMNLCLKFCIWYKLMMCFSYQTIVLYQIIDLMYWSV